MMPGASFSCTRVYTQDDFDRFAALSGDDNPIHVDPEFAARTRFGRTVCHGMLLYSSLCAALTEALTEALPGALGGGIAHLEQELMFVTPTYAGEEVTMLLQVAKADAGCATLDTVIQRPGGEVACQGRARVALPGEQAFALPAVPSPAGAASEAGAHKGLALGQRAQVVRTFTAADLQEYRSLTHDANPAYSDAAFAAAQGWPAPQVPAGLLGGLFSYLLGTQLPGRGANWLKQRLVYGARCFAGQPVTAAVEVVRLRPEKDLVNLRGTCTVGEGRIAVCTGESLVLVKDLVHAEA